MENVKYYVDKGLEFVTGDIVDNSDDNDRTSILPLPVYMLGNCNRGDYGYHGADVEGFAWRTNTGKPPSFVGEVEYKVAGFVKSGHTDALNFNLRVLDEWVIQQWRPVVIGRGVVPLDSVVDNPHPVYTKEMHDAGELPPVGSECIMVGDECNLEGVVMAYDGNSVWFKTNGSYKTRSGKLEFKPIQTEEASVVFDLMFYVDQSINEPQAKAIYKAGYRKVEEK